MAATKYFPLLKKGIQLFSSGGGTPTGPAGGDLSGTYPNPSVVDDSHNHTPGTSIPAYPTSLPPSGAAGGGLSGNYPNPSINAAILAAYELLSNKTSGITSANSSSTTLYPNIAAIMGLVGFVTPEMFGAAGDGTTNDFTAITNALTTGSPVFFNKKNYRTNSTITIPTGAFIRGSGYLSIISTTSNIPIFSYGANTTTNSNNIQIENLTFLGNSTGASQDGISAIGIGAFTTQRVANKVTNCAFVNLGGRGIYVQNLIGLSSGAQHQGTIDAINCHAAACGTGFFCDTRAEYNTFSNCVAYQCTTAGLYVVGGNNNWTGGQITDNAIGVKLGTGANDAHGSIVACKINHNVVNVEAIGLLNPFIFSGCDFYVSTSVTAGMLVSGCNHILYNGCEFSTNIISQANSSVRYVGCTFKTALTTSNFLVTAGATPLGTGNTFLAANTSLYLQFSGIAKLVSGTIVVTNASTPTTGNIRLTVQEGGNFNGNIRISARIAGTSFTILSSQSLDDCNVLWEIVT